MRISKLTIFLSLLLAASVYLNWYLIQRNKINGLVELTEFDLGITELLEENISINEQVKKQQQNTNVPQEFKASEDKELLNNLQKLFKEEAYDEAWLALSQSNSDNIRPLKKHWLETYTNWLINEPNAIRIDRFIDAGLRVYPDDVELRRLDAERLLVREDYIAAIDRLYALDIETHLNSQYDFSIRIEEIVEQRLKYLLERQEWQLLIDFTGRLLWHEPNNVAVIFKHAQALAQLERYNEAKSNLYLINNDVKYGSLATALINKIDQTILNVKLERKVIPLRTIGSHHIVRGLMDEFLPVNLMIDTGASLTVISETTFNALQQNSAVVFIREQQFTTASGKVLAPVYRVNSFRVDDFELFNVEVAVMDLETGRADQGLLGMNFLSQFDFKIDQAQNALILAPRN